MDARDWMHRTASGIWDMHMQREPQCEFMGTKKISGRKREKGNRVKKQTHRGNDLVHLVASGWVLQT